MSLDQPNDFVKHQTLTRDAFLGGRLVVSQPGHGFRAGVDSVILGAAVNPASTRLLDMGAGVGVAGMVAMADLPQLKADLVEIDEETLGITHINLRDNSLADRARAFLVDVTAKGSERAAAGVEADAYTSVIANPPYFGSNGTISPKAGRATARHMDAEQLALWVRAAAMHAAPGGEIIFVHVAQVLPRRVREQRAEDGFGVAQHAVAREGLVDDERGAQRHPPHLGAPLDGCRLPGLAGEPEPAAGVRTASGESHQLGGGAHRRGGVRSSGAECRTAAAPRC